MNEAQRAIADDMVEAWPAKKYRKAFRADIDRLVDAGKAPSPAVAAGKLLPCPHCGSSHVDPEGLAWKEGGEGPMLFGPVCEGCDATAPSVEAWNRRATDLQLTWHDEQHRMALKAGAVTVGAYYRHNKPGVYKPVCYLSLPGCFQFTLGSAQEAEAQLERVARHWFALAGAAAKPDEGDGLQKVINGLANAVKEVDYKSLLRKYMLAVESVHGDTFADAAVISAITPQEGAVLAILAADIEGEAR